MDSLYLIGPRLGNSPSYLSLPTIGAVSSSIRRKGIGVTLANWAIPRSRFCELIFLDPRIGCISESWYKTPSHTFLGCAKRALAGRGGIFAAERDNSGICDTVLP